MKKFGGDAAQSDHDHRAEHSILFGADDQLDAAGQAHHGLNGDATNLSLRPGAADIGEHLVVCGSHLCFVGQIEGHATDVGLVRDLRRNHLQYDGKADRACQRNDLVGRMTLAGLGHGDSIGAQERFGFRLVQHVVTGRE